MALAAALALLVAAAGQAAAARNDRLGLTLAPAAAATAAQGQPFAFTAHVTSDTPLTDAIVFTLISPGNASVAFADRFAVVAPGIPGDLAVSVTPAQWFGELGRYAITASLDGQQLGQPMSFEVTKPLTTVPKFQNVTGPVGLTTSLPPTDCGRWSNGAAWGDVNGDGLLDLYVTRSSYPAQLFVQHRGGTFTEEAAVRGVALAGFPALGASFADYDNDGHPDLAVVGDGTAHLLRNDGTGHFTDVSTHARIGANADYMGMSASWADYDNDGKLDVYIANHSRCAPIPTNRGNVVYNPDQLYHNNGDGTFTEVSSILGTNADGTAATMGAGFLGAWFDANGDGRQDLYLANDYLGVSPDRNRIWINQGGGQFLDASVASGTAFAMNTMGVGIGDYDRDGRLDFALTKWGKNRLLHNNGDGTFTDVAAQARIERQLQRADGPTVGWGMEFGDLNDDGWQDLYVDAGTLDTYLTPPSIPQPNELLVNDKHGSFYDLSSPSSADDVGESRGVAMADYNRDGRLDLYVVNQGGEPHLFRNATKLPRYTHWLEVDTVGTVSNRDGCGTTISILNQGRPLLREVLCGSTSVSSGSSKIVHFGLGANRKLKTVSLRVAWPSGIKQTLSKVKVDRLVTLTEPKA